MAYYNPHINWVLESPIYTLNNDQAFFIAHLGKVQRPNHEMPPVQMHLLQREASQFTQLAV